MKNIHIPTNDLLQNTTNDANDVIGCLERGETLAGLQYFGITYSDDNFEKYSPDYDMIMTLPREIIVDTDKYYSTPIDPVLALDDHILDCDDCDDDEFYSNNPYYQYMTNLNEYYLSGDDSYFDYGNSWVLIIHDAVGQYLANK